MRSISSKAISRPRTKSKRPTSKVRIAVGAGKYFIAACLFFNSSQAQTDVITKQLAQTEREFSLEATTKGIRGAFLEYFDDDCIVFAPRPTNGKKAYSADSDSPSSLTWRPTVVEVSSSGDLGYTTGPSEYHEGNSPPDSVHYGHFVSLWKRNSHGDWKVILDFGSGYPKWAVKEEQSRYRQLPSSRTGGAHERARRITWQGADSAYSALSRAKGSKAALQTFASEDVRVYRKGKFPVEGLDSGCRSARGFFQVSVIRRRSFVGRRSWLHVRPSRYCSL